jgi:hypothetical protein
MWTAAEAANLLFVLVTYVIIGSIELKHWESRIASMKMLPENAA